MTNKSIRDYITLIENAQQGVAEGSTTPKVTFAQSTPGSWARIDILVNGVKQFVAAKTVGPGFWSIFDLENENIGSGSNKSEIKSAVLDYLSRQGVAEGSASQIKPYSGKPEGYTFSRVQQKNYDMLVAILARNGMKFTKIDASTYPGERSYIDRLSKSTPIMLTTFKVKSPALEWHKYEGFTAGGGQNTVKVGGKKMKLTDFLRLEPKQQDALLKSGPGVAEHQVEESTPDALAKIDNLFRK